LQVKVFNLDGNASAHKKRIAELGSFWDTSHGNIHTFNV